MSNQEIRVGELAGRRILRIDMTDPDRPTLIGFETGPAARVVARKRLPRRGEIWHSDFSSDCRIVSVVGAVGPDPAFVIVQYLDNTSYYFHKFEYFLSAFTYQSNGPT